MRHQLRQMKNVNAWVTKSSRQKLYFAKNIHDDNFYVLRDNENYSDFISRTRGIALIWVIAFPLAIVLYGNVPNASITVLALAVVATVLVVIVFPGQPEQKKAPIVTEEIELPQNEIVVIRYLRLFFIKFDRFIWNFMIMWMGPFFIGVGNLFGMVALLELGKSTHPSADISLSIVRTLMITSWFFIAFCYWYLAKYYPDDYKGGKF